jgi:DNA-binding transcriptional LysR family regulator
MWKPPVALPPASGPPSDQTPHAADPSARRPARAVAREGGLALLPVDVVEPIIPDVVCRPVELPPRALHLTLAWRDGDGSDPVPAFTALVEANMPVGA